MNDAILVQLRGSKEILIHEPTLAIPGCPASVYGDAAATDSARWLRGLDPFQLSRRHSSQWIKVVLVPGDVVVIPKRWWHAVRSTPGSVAISVPVRLETIDGRTVRRRTCRRDAQPVPAVRGHLGSLPTGGQPSNSRRTDYSLTVDGTVAHYYALTDTQLATDCQVEYERLDGRVITWHTGDNLSRFADAAAAVLGLGAQQTAPLAEWMARFQLRPTQGGAVLTTGAEAEEHGEPDPREAQQTNVREHEHWEHGRFRYHPADSYTNEGELRVYTQPLSSDARLRSAAMVRHAVHDVVNVRLASCMELGTEEESNEAHDAFVIRQHGDGTCDVRLADDLATTVLSVRARFSTYEPGSDVRARLSEYDGDMHCASTLHTENGARVSRRGGQRKVGKPYSSDPTGDGPSARA